VRVAAQAKPGKAAQAKPREGAARSLAARVAILGKVAAHSGDRAQTCGILLSFPLDRATCRKFVACIGSPRLVRAPLGCQHCSA
jgi:hypothetical protein